MIVLVVALTLRFDQPVLHRTTLSVLRLQPQDTMSKVWKHFSRVEGEASASCNFCHKAFKYKGTISALVRHLKNKTCKHLPKWFEYGGKGKKRNQRSIMDLQYPTKPTPGQLHMDIVTFILGPSCVYSTCAS